METTKCFNKADLMGHGQVVAFSSVCLLKEFKSFSFIEHSIFYKTQNWWFSDIPNQTWLLLYFEAWKGGTRTCKAACSWHAVITIDFTFLQQLSSQEARSSKAWSSVWLNHSPTERVLCYWLVIKGIIWRDFKVSFVVRALQAIHAYMRCKIAKIKVSNPKRYSF